MGLVRNIAALFSRSAGRRRSTSDPRHALGLAGERLAEAHLKRNGYRVLCRNYRTPRGGEVDLVCRDKDGDILVFVEVKTRRSAEHGSPADAVTREKQELICRGARSWLAMLDREDIVFRFDIVEVILAENGEPHFRIFKSAFQLPETRRP